MLAGLTRALAVVLLGTTAGVLGQSGAHAASGACPAGTGVTVVVGSGVRCDTDGGTPALDNFKDTGHALTPVTTQPGFVCRVDGQPSADEQTCKNTPPDDAYWGLFWSDGTSGTWVYASQGVGSLKVPAGGWVAFVFQTGGGRTYPSMSPTGPAPAPKPTPTKKPAPAPKPTPTTQSGSGGSGSGSSGSGSTSGPPPSGATPTAAPSTTGSPATPTPTPSATPSAKPTPTSTTATSTASTTDPGEDAATAATSETDDPGTGSGGPGLVAAGVLAAVLLGGMGVVLWRRKVAGGPS